MNLRALALALLLGLCNQTWHAAGRGDSHATLNAAGLMKFVMKGGTVVKDALPHEGSTGVAARQKESER